MTMANIMVPNQWQHTFPGLVDNYRCRRKRCHQRMGR
jgi:hypothetical protein